MKSFKVQFILALTMVFHSITINAQQRFHNINTTSFVSHSTSSMQRAGSVESAPVNCIGSPKIPIVLVEFSDRFFLGEDNIATADFYNKHFNGNGISGEHYTAGNSYGSVYDYFNEESDGKFQPQFSIIGPIRLSQSYAYYGKNSTSSIDVNIDKFYSEACKLASSNYSVDWSYFDNNNDGIIDFVFFIYAGEPESYSGADPNNIWPKEGTGLFKVNIDGGTTIKFGGYGCANEMYPQQTKREGIGNICHEFSHAIGLPDFYDTRTNVAVTNYGMDYWSIMDYGQYSSMGYHPCALTAYEREFFGWRSIETVNYSDDLTLTLRPMEQKGAVAYKIENPLNSNEYFILENRQDIGWDEKLAFMSDIYGSGHGLMITHVDYNKSAWETNVVNTTSTHQRMTPVVADGDYMPGATHYSATGAKNLLADTYPGYKDITEMSSYATFTGGSINMKITEIKEENQVITLKLNNGGQPTSIQTITDTKLNKDIRDLYGRKVSNPSHGILIINGKKIFLK